MSALTARHQCTSRLCTDAFLFLIMTYDLKIYNTQCDLLYFCRFRIERAFHYMRIFSPSIVWCSSSLHIIYYINHRLFVAYELFGFCNSSGGELNRTENVNANVSPPPHLPRVNMSLRIFFLMIFCIFSGLHIRHILRKMSIICNIRSAMIFFFFVIFLNKHAVFYDKNQILSLDQNIHYPQNHLLALPGITKYDNPIIPELIVRTVR